MSTQEAEDRPELLQGTLDLLILRTLIFGSQQGQGIARAIQQTLEEKLLAQADEAMYRKSERTRWLAKPECKGCGMPQLGSPSRPHSPEKPTSKSFLFFHH